MTAEMVSKVAISVMLMAACMCGTELLLRTLLPTTFWNAPYKGDWDWMQDDAVVGWENRPGYEHEHSRINALGLRGDPTTARKPAGVLRIVCLGDSGTFGVWKKRGTEKGWENYPDELRRLLAEGSYDQVEVLNAGVLGYATGQALRQLVVRILPLDPDIITVRLGFNDHGRAWSAAKRLPEPRSEIIRTLFYWFSDWRVVELWLLARQKVSFFDSPPLSLPWATEEEYAYNLARFGEVATANGIRLLLIDYPLRPLSATRSWADDDQDHPLHRMRALLGVQTLEELDELHNAYQAIARRVAIEASIPMLDTHTRCSVPDAGCFGPNDVAHPTAGGAEIIGALLLEKLSALGWLDGRAPGAPTR